MMLTVICQSICPSVHPSARPSSHSSICINICSVHNGSLLLSNPFWSLNHELWDRIIISTWFLFGFHNSFSSRPDDADNCQHDDSGKHTSWPQKLKCQNYLSYLFLPCICIASLTNGPSAHFNGNNAKFVWSLYTFDSCWVASKMIHTCTCIRKN